MFLVKVDGERSASEKRYTLLLSGEHLGEYLRRDTSDLHGGIAEIICEYAALYWDIPRLS